MTDSHWPSASNTRAPAIGAEAAATIAGGTIAAVIIASLAVPRATMTFIGLLGILALARYMMLGGSWRALLRLHPVATPVFMIGLAALASALWSAAPLQSLEVGAVFCGNVVLCWLIAHWMAAEPAPVVASLRRGILVGVVIGLGLLLVEVLSDQALRRFAFNAIPALRPEHMHYVDVKGDTITRIRFHQLNRHVAVAVLLLWPAVLLAAMRTQGVLRHALIAGLVAVTGAITLLSWHESSKLALIASIAAYGLARLAGRLASRVIAAGFVLMAVTVLPASIAAFQSGLHEATWIQETGRARLILWGTTAERVLEHPIIGIGAGAGRVLDDKVKDTAPVLPGQPYALRTGPHQHNIYLQTWYELGAIGVFLLAIAGMAVLTALDRLGEREGGRYRPQLLAAFVAATCMAGVSYGLWQAWFQAAFGIAAVIVLASFGSRDRERAQAT